VSSLVSYLDPMIDPGVPVPPYLQLAAILRNRIDDGTITGRLPSEKMLAQEFGLAQGTVRRALDILREEGRITTVHGYGSFVRQGPG
jgi:GntR family transcriptional regulator